VLPAVRLGITGGEIIGVQIGRDQLGLDAEKTFEVFDTGFKRLQCFVVLQVTDVVAYESIALTGQAEGVFQFGAHRQDLFHWLRKLNPLWGITA